MLASTTPMTRYCGQRTRKIQKTNMYDMWAWTHATYSTLAIVMCSMLPNLWLYRGSSHRAMNPQNYGTICQDMPRHYTRLASSENRVCLKIQWFISNLIIICHMSIATHGDVKPILRQTYVGAILKWEPQIDRSYCFPWKGKSMVLEPQFEVPTICGSIFLRKRQQIPMASHIQPSFPPLRNILRCSYSHNCHNLGVYAIFSSHFFREQHASRQGIHPAELLRR